MAFSKWIITKAGGIFHVRSWTYATEFLYLLLFIQKNNTSLTPQNNAWLNPRIRLLFPELAFGVDYTAEMPEPTFE